MTFLTDIEIAHNAKLENIGKIKKDNRFITTRTVDGYTDCPKDIHDFGTTLSIL